MIAIQELFDDGENVLSCNPDITFLHTFWFISFFFYRRLLQIACQKLDVLSRMNYIIYYQNYMKMLHLAFFVEKIQTRIVKKHYICNIKIQCSCVEEYAE